MSRGLVMVMKYILKSLSSRDITISFNDCRGIFMMVSCFFTSTSVSLINRCRFVFVACIFTSKTEPAGMSIFGVANALPFAK